MGPRYRFSIGTGYTGEKRVENLGRKLGKTWKLARNGSRKIGFEQGVVRFSPFWK